MSSYRRKRKQKQQIKLILVLLLLVFSMIMLSSFIFKDNHVKAAEFEFETSYKSIVIYYGDTLWDIAKDHYDPDYYSLEEYVDKIIAINNMSSTHIQAGHTIMVPIVIE